MLALVAAGVLFTLQSPGAAADPLPLGATSGVISVSMDDYVTGQPLPGQCVDIQATQVCDGDLSDEDADTGQISVTQPFGSYVVGYDPVNQPADRLVKAPTAVACELSAQAPFCSVVFSFNPPLVWPPMYPTPVNLFLTDQDGNVAPPTCADATDVLTLTYSLPSAPPAAVGGFELGLAFDPAFVCIAIEAGTYFMETPGSVCFVADMGSSPGVERLGCVVSGDPETTSSSLEMMVVHVRAQPSQYASIFASQDNGTSATLLAVDCHAADLDGQPIEVLACRDYELTIRRVEGDVNGDCTVDIRDAQLLAFRVGGGYRILWLEDSPFDVEPPGPPPGDGQLDIEDVQFIYGRHGSACAAPIPYQPPRSSY